MPLGIVLGILVVVIGLRVLADRVDRERIRKDVVARGGEVLDISWSPFGRGWFGEKSDRIYRVTWTDASRGRHESFCKTSLFTGVYWTEDAPPPASRADGDDVALRKENERLREENDRLRRGRT